MAVARDGMMGNLLEGHIGAVYYVGTVESMRVHALEAHACWRGLGGTDVVTRPDSLPSEAARTL